MYGKTDMHTLLFYDKSAFTNEMLYPEMARILLGLVFA